MLWEPRSVYQSNVSVVTLSVKLLSNVFLLTKIVNNLKQGKTLRKNSPIWTKIEKLVLINQAILSLFATIHPDTNVPGISPSKGFLKCAKTKDKILSSKQTNG